MLNAKFNLNGLDIILSGDKEDIIYALKNTTSSTIPSSIPLGDKLKKKNPLFSKEEMVKMYEYLSTQGDFRIQQFEITRGTDKSSKYKVCLAFDVLRQRYIYYNPKSEDKFIASYTIDDVINKINNSESGFSLIHPIANKINEKMKLVSHLHSLSDKEDGFVAYSGESSLIKGALNAMKNEYMEITEIWKIMQQNGCKPSAKRPLKSLYCILCREANKPNSMVEKFDNGNKKEISKFRLKQTHHFNKWEKHIPRTITAKLKARVLGGQAKAAAEVEDMLAVSGEPNLHKFVD